jgi:hypothetical protein
MWAHLLLFHKATSQLNEVEGTAVGMFCSLRAFACTGGQLMVTSK